MTNIKAWPFKEAAAILQKINHKVPEKSYVLFETGYGPSGLPHIGTFGEVVRTVMVQKAFHVLSDNKIPTKLFCMSDDMDGLRKVPENIPNREHYYQYIGKPLTSIPDPFGSHKSYGEHMNSRLCAFLDDFNFEYTFVSATNCYKTGKFNEMLIKVLENYEKIMHLMLPTLGEERQATYSPFLPICKRTGKVLQVPITAHNVASHTITYNDPETNEDITVKITDGNCKLQWKPDFGMRWAALDVDFEMFGKDVGINANLYTKICQIIGGKGPQQMIYEMFLDEEGKKISKSKGTGLSVEEWLRYAPPESLKYFMYNAPQRAKKLSIDVIPKYVDEYIAYLKNYNLLEGDARYENPVYHCGEIDAESLKIITENNLSYNLLLNLVMACNTDDIEVIWGYLAKFGASSASCKFIAKMVENTINYYCDLVKPNRKYKSASDSEKDMIMELHHFLMKFSDKNTTSGEIQNELYRIARERDIDMKDWFKSLYQILLGTDSGPRFGSFIILYGVKKTIELINSKIGIEL